MKGSGLLSFLSLLLLFFISSSSAWPWPDSLQEKVDALILRRQEEKPTATATTTETTDSTASASSASTDGETSAATFSTAAASASNTASSSGTDNASGTKTSSKTGTKTTSTKTSAVSIDPQDPPGGISLITPAPIDGVQFYKVGDYVTFKWNYTSLSVTPKYIDVLASCSVNQATYTISSNMSVEETGALTWDTGDFPATVTQPFVVASYTLIVHDSTKDVTDVPQAGYLGAYAQYVFGMYTPQPYTPLNEFKCATCNGAMSIHEKQALGVILMTAAITLMSFTWFASGFGVF